MSSGWYQVLAPLDPQILGTPSWFSLRGTRLPAGNGFWVWPGRRKRMRGFNPRELHKG